MGETVIVWAIKGLRGAIVLPSIRTTRAICINDYVKLPGNSGVDRSIKNRWRKLHKWGWRCIKVELRPTTQKEM